MSDLCRCVLVIVGTVAHCSAEVGPDRPFCPACEDRHADRVGSWVKVTALPIGQPHPWDDEEATS